RHSIAGTDFQRHRQTGEVDRKREKISAIPRSLSTGSDGRVRAVGGANAPVTDALEKTAVNEPLQRINTLTMVGRVTPCAPRSGVQRTARPTFSARIQRSV